MDSKPSAGPGPQAGAGAGANKWKFSVCDCFGDFPLCAKSCFCAPCQLGKSMASASGQECGPQHFIMACCCFVCCNMQNRGSVRIKYGLEGNTPMDCALTLCLGVCSLTQVVREQKARGEPVELFAAK